MVWKKLLSRGFRLGKEYRTRKYTVTTDLKQHLLVEPKLLNWQIAPSEQNRFRTHDVTHFDTAEGCLYWLFRSTYVADK